MSSYNEFLNTDNLVKRVTEQTDVKATITRRHNPPAQIPKELEAYNPHSGEGDLGAWLSATHNRRLEIDVTQAARSLSQKLKDGDLIVADHTPEGVAIFSQVSALLKSEENAELRNRVQQRVNSEGNSEFRLDTFEPKT